MPDPSPTDELPLAGIRVLEFGQMIALPAATHLLGSYGAEVIKVEDVGPGDGLRYFGSQKNGMSGWFISANNGKRSIALDMKSDEGQEIIWRLIDGADVFAEGFRAGVMDRLGFGYEAVSRRNPKIVYCSSSGFGPSGPYAERPVYDPLIQAMAGWAGIQEQDGRPTLVRGMVADKVGAYTNVQAIMAALIKRGRTGEGSHVQVSMLEASLQFNWSDVMMDSTLLDDDAEHRPNMLKTYRLYQCSDGWVSIAASTDQQWKSMCEGLDRMDCYAEERFHTSAGRGAALAAFFELMDSMVINFTVDEVVDRLHKADVPVAPVLDPQQVYADKQVVAAGLVEEFNHPVTGRVRQPRAASGYFGLRWERGPAPRHGEHTRKILEELGFEKDRIDSLVSAKSVKQAK